MKTVAELEARIKELEDAVRWALGEDVSDFGDIINPEKGKYWWRDELRARAFPPKFVEKNFERPLCLSCEKFTLVTNGLSSCCSSEWVNVKCTYNILMPAKIKHRKEIPNQNGWWKVLGEVSNKSQGGKLFFEWED